MCSMDMYNIYVYIGGGRKLGLDRSSGEGSGGLKEVPVW